eukprot:gene8406-11365_t
MLILICNRIYKLKPNKAIVSRTYHFCNNIKSNDLESINHLEYSKLANDRIKGLSCSSNRVIKSSLLRSIDYLDLVIERQLNNKKTTILATDNFCDSELCNLLCSHLVGSELKSFMVSPGERKLSSDTSTLEYVLSDYAIGIIDHFKLKITKYLRSNRNIFIENKMSPLFEAGSIISWLSPPHSINNNNSGTNLLPVNEIVPIEGTYSYWSAHCDKANNNEYDLSVLLYLNNEFSCGNLVFMDENGEDFVIEPKRGRLVIFNSCIENIHRVQAVTEGNRFLLSVWFSNKYYK